MFHLNLKVLGENNGLSRCMPLSVRERESKQDYMYKLLLSRPCRSSERKEKKTAVFVTQSVRMEGKCCVNITCWVNESVWILLLSVNTAVRELLSIGPLEG